MEDFKKKRDGIKMIEIRKANAEDAAAKRYIHYHSWNETYTGLIDQNYLDTRTLDKCVALARKYPQNTYVAEVDGKIVGFSCYVESRDENLEDTGEIMAVYILKDYFGLGIGKKLMEACYNELKCYSKIALCVLNTNDNAISFYEHLGFKKDGKEKKLN